jgi:uncharacterized protein YgbK (DUF1537 family)
MPNATLNAAAIASIRSAEMVARQPPPQPRPGALERIRAANASRHTKLVILDDDPTGTQTVAGVPVITAWRDADLQWGLEQPGSMFAVLTNSRSLREAEAVELNRDLGRRLASLASDRGLDLRCISRSDSTLRGHFPAETRALAAGLEEGGQPTSGVLLCPCFLEAGRVTVEDVHWVTRGERLVPVAETEFARDPAFGYQHSDLRRWVIERQGGSLDQVRSVSLTDLRNAGAARVAGKLAGLKPTDVAIANAIDHTDLQALVIGLLEAEANGARPLYRTGPSFLSARSGQAALPPLDPRTLAIRDGPGLLVVGSYTDLTTRQLRAVQARHAIPTVELQVPELASDEGWSRQVETAAQKLNRALRAGDAVLATSRAPAARSGHAESLGFARRIADALVEVVRRIDPRITLGWVVAKGGITSSDIATRALQARGAIVRGQLFPGLVSVWTLAESSARPGLTYVVFAGNVGDEGTLADTIERLTGRS